jgi:hypothetical protein
MLNYHWFTGAELEPLVGWGADTQEDGCFQDDGGEEKIQEESLSKEEKKFRFDCHKKYVIAKYKS